MKNSVIFLLRSLLILSLSSLLQAMPPHPDLLDRIQSGQQSPPYYLSHLAELRAAGVNSSTRPRTISELNGPLLEEDFPILVILVDFSDNISHVAGNSFDSLLFGNQTGSLKHYYRQVTYDNLNVITLNLPGALGWSRAPQTYSYYVNNQNGLGAYPQNSQRLVEDIVNALNPVVDFSDYDSDGDGYVDGLFVIHAGRGAEYSGNNSDIWSHAWGTHTRPLVDGVRVSAYSMEPEYWSSYGDMTVGVYAHEMGHAVFGLPDLYDTDYTSRGLGKWSLMAGGSWNGTLGNSPAHPDAWCRMIMGAVTPTNVVSNLTGASIPQVETNPTVYRLWTDGAVGNQYFLIENRQRTGYDTGLPASGLLIYHIDTGVSGNTNEWYPGLPGGSHYRVALEQADGLWQLEHNTNTGNNADPYPGSTNNQTFDDSSTPNSKNYALANTGVSVRNISASGATMTADLTVTSCTPPAQVTGLTASNNRCADVLLSWSDVTGATGFRVYRNGTQIGSDLAAHTVTYNDVSAVAGTTYSYTVSALTGSCSGTPSSAASGVRASGPPQVTGVSATTNRCSDIIITWNDLASETGYRIFRGGGQIGTDIAANTTSYTDESVTPGTNYSYVVVAFNSTCTGPNSSSATGTRVITPAQVTNVSASNNRCSDVQITWTDVANESGYRVLRNGTQIGSNLAANTTSYLDASASAGVSYDYSIVAFNGACMGTASAVSSGTRTAAPSQVTGVTATNNRCSDVMISWSSLTGITGYRVYRNGISIADPGNVTSYNDAGAVQGVSYNYTVAGISGSCVGPQSSSTVGMRAVTPPQVTGVSATNNRCSDIIIGWSDIASAAGFRVFRNGTQIGNDLPAHTVSYVDSTTAPGVTHPYTVQAFTTNCTGLASASVNGMKIFGPTQVTGVSATTNRCTDVLITWTDISGESGYRVYRGGSQVGTTLAANTTSYYDTYAAAGISYSYTVAAVNGTCTGQQSSASTGLRLTTPVQVTNVSATNNRCSDVMISWSDLSDETGYRVFRNGTQLSSDLAANTVSYIDPTATAGITYSYTVSAFSGICNGTLSSAVSGIRPTAPIQVSGVTATNNRCNNIVIGWNDLTGELGYRVFRDGIQIGSDLLSNTNFYSDASAEPSTVYSYTVVAFNASCSGAASNAATGMRLATPSQVTNVSATTNRCSDVMISWSDVASASGFRVQRNGIQIGGDLAAHTTSYTDLSAVAGTVYTYSVIAFNSSCSSAASEAIGQRQITPTQVTQVTASTNHCDDVLISWSDVTTAGGFRVLRNGTQIGSDLAAHTISYTDFSAVAGTNYSYSVIAFNSNCTSIPSSEANGQRLVTPSQVTQVTATTNRCDNVLVSWGDVASALGFRVLRNGVQIGSDLAAHTVSYTDLSAVAGTLYSYTVIAFNSNCSSIASSEALGQRQITPTQVTQVTASTNRCDDVLVSWSDVAAAGGFRVLRNGAQISSDLAAHTTSYSDQSAIAGVVYAYSVIAFNGSCVSPVSAAVNGTRLIIPAQITGLTASQNRCNDIQLFWNEIASASGYRIFRNGTQLGGDLPIHTTSYIDASASPGQSYQYSVAAFNGNCAGAQSANAQGIRLTTLAAVSGVSATDNLCSNIQIVWNSLSGADSFVIQRNGQRIGGVSSYILSFTDATALEQSYEYRVIAYNACGQGNNGGMDIGTRRGAPDSVTAAIASTNRCADILLEWNSVDDAAGYTILRNNDSLATVSSNTNSYADLSAIAGQSYSYRLRAFNGCGNAGASSAMTGTRLALPAQVTEISATTNRCDSVIITWTQITNATSYRIYQDGSEIAQVSAPVNTFSTDCSIGTHSFYIITQNSCGSGEASPAVVGTKLESPGAIGNVFATNNLCSMITIAWSAAAGHIDEYVITRDGMPVDSVTDLQFNDITDGNHTYQVYAWSHDCGNGELSAAILGIAHSPLPSPVSLTASSEFCSHISLAWTAVNDANGYLIVRDGIFLDTVSASAQNFDDYSCDYGTFVYTVTAFNACGEGQSTNAVSGVRRAAPQIVNTVTATQTECQAITVNWTDVVEESGYTVFRNDDSLASLYANETQFTDITAVPEVVYAYSIRAYNDCGTASLSATAEGVRPSVPPQVTNVIATDSRCDSIVITWVGFRGDVVYHIFRDSLEIGEVSFESLRYADTPPYGTHHYSVQARNACGSSPLSEQAAGNLIEPPSAPEQVVASDTLCGQVFVEWSLSAGSVDNYIVLRDGEVIATLSSDMHHFTDDIGNGEYAYTIRARGACGDSPVSMEDMGASHGVPDAPPGLDVAEEACNAIQLSWTALRGDIHQYLVYRDGVLFDSTDTILYSDTTLHNSTEHTYTITARDIYCGESAPSEPITAGLQPLTNFIHALPDTVSSGDTLRIQLEHCDGVTSDSVFISLDNGEITFLTLYTPVQNLITFAVPTLENLYTDECYLLVVSHREARVDSLLTPAFVIYSQTTDAVTPDRNGIPSEFVLNQNYPNPFNPSTTISYGLPIITDVTIEIFDILGHYVSTLVNGKQSPGMHTATWNGSNNASGVYVLRMRAGKNLLTQKMMLLK